LQGAKYILKNVKRNFLGQQVLFETKFLKTGPKKVNLATLLHSLMVLDNDTVQWLPNTYLVQPSSGYEALAQKKVLSGTSNI